jgi:hypothetical protein
LFTIEASPVVAGALEPVALGEGDAELLADADGEDEGEELADGEAELDALAAGAALSLVADSACPEPPLLLGDGLDEALAEELADAFGDELADPDGDADELGEALGDGATRSAAGAQVVPTPLHSSTWRNRSSAVVPTRAATFCAPAPGTDTVMY